MRLNHSNLLPTFLAALVAATLLPAGIASAGIPVIHTGLVTENPEDWTPHALNGQVNALVPIGDRIIAAGDFTQVRNAGNQSVQTRTHVMAFDAQTGEIEPAFAPVLDGPVLAAVADPLVSTSTWGASSTTSTASSGERSSRSTRPPARWSRRSRLPPTSRSWTWRSGTAGCTYPAQFEAINGVSRSGFAAVDLGTGAVDQNVNIPFTSPIKGAMNVRNIDVTPDGTRLVAVGNFRLAAGQDRFQIAVVNLTTSPTTLANWQTNRFKDACNSVFNTYMRDLDISPDGTYFVVTTTGSYGGGPPKLCDSVSRWELGQVGSALNPSWVDYAGGDTTTAVEIVGGVVYTGGHQRWVNNPYKGDAAGPGTYPVEGLAALSPESGVPFTWNPTRERGYGVSAFTPTATGLWVGSDTDILHGEFHGRIGFFPLAGGITPPASKPYRLPNDLHNVTIVNGNNNDLWVRRSYAGSGAFGTAGTVSTNWDNMRGAFALNGNVYMGMSDGKIYRRTFDGAAIGAPTALNLYGLDSAPSGFKIPGTNTAIPKLTDQIKNSTGMAYEKGRLYYTVQSDSRLYMRYFNPQSEIIGGELFVASTGDGVDWANVRGFTIADGSLYFAKTDNKLYRVAFPSGKPSGSVTQVSGSGIDSNQWQSHALFVFRQTTDGFAPTVPGTPTGSSTRAGEVDLQWTASSDTGSDTLTYRVFRNGSQVGQVVSDATGTIDFTDETAPPGTDVTYRVSALDAANNSSAQSAASATIHVAAPDTSAPTVPGTPTGTATGKTKIDLTWAASSDAVSIELTYRIYRDSVEVGQVVSNSNSTVSFTDTGLSPASSYSYTVDATDGENNSSAQSDPSETITTPGIAFADDFSSGDFAAWTEVDNFLVDGTAGNPSAPSALMQTVSDGATLRKDLDASLIDVCVSTQVRVQSTGGTALDLLRLRSTANGPIARSYIGSDGKLYLRSDFSGLQKNSGATLQSGWNALEVCGTVGTGTTWDVYLNGAQIVTDWAADTGSDGVGRVQIGDPGNKTITANWDDVIVDTVPD